MFIREGVITIAINRDVRQCVILLTDIEEIGIRKRAELILRFLPRINHSDRDELLRCRKRQWLKKNGVDHGEDRRVTADAERKCQDRD